MFLRTVGEKDTGGADSAPPPAFVGLSKPKSYGDLKNIVPLPISPTLISYASSISLN